MAKVDSSKLRLLLVPGGGGSGPDHWHNFWASSDNRCSWVNQVDSTGGTRDDWVRRLDVIVRSAARPTVLVAHSLACVVVAHWAAQHLGSDGDQRRRAARSGVIGAMLVAPADIEQVPELHTEPYNEFVPIPMTPLPFPSIVVASNNDPLLTVGRADALASAWGSEIEYIGDHLHVGSDALLGQWPQGISILNKLLRTIGVEDPVLQEKTPIKGSPPYPSDQ